MYPVMLLHTRSTRRNRESATRIQELILKRVRIPNQHLPPCRSYRAPLALFYLGNRILTSVAYAQLRAANYGSGEAVAV